MSIQTEINRIRQAKKDIISQIKAKGVTVPTDASLDDLSALVQAIEVSSSEDLSSELNTQNSLITTQETTIDNIISALQGKASGGSGGGISNENVSLDLKITTDDTSSCTYTYAYLFKDGSYEEYGVSGASVSSNANYSKTLGEFLKGSFLYIKESTGNSSINVNSATNGIEVMGDGNSELIVYVPTSGTLDVSIEGWGSGGGW